MPLLKGPQSWLVLTGVPVVVLRCPLRVSSHVSLAHSGTITTRGMGSPLMKQTHPGAGRAISVHEDTGLCGRKDGGGLDAGRPPTMPPTVPPTMPPTALSDPWLPAGTWSQRALRPKDTVSRLTYWTLRRPGKPKRTCSMPARKQQLPEGHDGHRLNGE